MQPIIYRLHYNIILYNEVLKTLWAQLFPRFHTTDATWRTQRQIPFTAFHLSIHYNSHCGTLLQQLICLLLFLKVYIMDVFWSRINCYYCLRVRIPDMNCKKHFQQAYRNTYSPRTLRPYPLETPKTVNPRNSFLATQLVQAYIVLAYVSCEGLQSQVTE